MNKLPFSFYPHGAEMDPYAPYNQDDEPDTEGDDYVDQYDVRIDVEELEGDDDGMG